MRWDWNKPSHIFAIILLAALVSLIPRVMTDIGGDRVFQFVMIDCFSQQFWQGDFYPRWCFEAKAGLGAPYFLFYPPLAYYITALIYPLTYLGVSTAGIYICGLFLATLLTGATCYLWLKDIVSPGRALLASVLFLFMPYRMELLLFRSAYAELWAMALIPLVFKYARRLAHGDQETWRPLAITFGLLLFCHLTSSFVALMTAGIYVLIIANNRQKTLLHYGLSVFGGIMLAAIYLLPALYYRNYVFAENMADAAWANSFLTFKNFNEQGRVVLASCITLLALSVFFFAFWIKKQKLDRILRREVLAWGIIFVVCAFLLFPVSRIFYALIGPLSAVAFPWRMQLAFPFCLTWLIAVWMQSIAAVPPRKTWKADYGMLFLLLVLMSWLVVGSMQTDSIKPAAQQVAGKIIGTDEYRTKWTDEKHGSKNYLMQRARKTDPAKVSWVKGKGLIEIHRWSWKGIELVTNSTGKIRLRLEHHYFPIWKGKSLQGGPVELSVEKKSGLMLVDIPPGPNRFRLNYAIISAGFHPGLASLMLSMLGLIILCRRLTIKAFL